MGFGGIGRADGGEVVGGVERCVVRPAAAWASLLRRSWSPWGPDRARRTGGEGRIEADVGLHGVTVAAQVVDGLAGAADSVALGLAEAVQPGFTGNGLELLALQEPVGEVLGNRGSEGGDEAVFLVVAEGEVGAGLQGGESLQTCRGGTVSGCGTPAGPQRGGGPGL
ncbi:hypothetical protein GCM10020256_11090 [Streptomyces thermocoprophilus]